MAKQRDRANMHILFLNFKKFWGGGEKMACTLAEGIRVHGHTVSFLVLPNAPLQARLVSLGIRVAPVRYRNPIKLVKTFLQNGPYDLIVTQSTQELQYAYYLSLLSSTPIAVRLGVSDIPAVGLINRLLHRLTVKVNFTNFHAGLKMLHDAYGNALRKTVFLPNSVSAPRAFSEDCRHRMNIPATAVVVGMVGRLEERKGCRILLSAYRSLANRFHNLHLLFVGEGELLAELTEASGDRIHVTGFVNNVGDVFRTIDILTLPVLWGEGTSNAVLEAMSLGVPVITTQDGGMAEAVRDGETGLVVQKGSQPDLERALAELLLNKDLRIRLGKAGKVHVQKHFSPNRMIDIFLQHALHAVGR
jgi:glycosyltransferase involved in cell wall biosynthesis